MRSKICQLVLILMLVIHLAGCEKSEIIQNSKDEFLKHMHGGDFGFASMSASGEAYHIVVGTTLYYVDKESMKGIISCAKPECTHQGEDFDSGCNSRLGLGNGLCYSAEKLLFIDTNYKTHMFSLFSSDLDGTNRREVQPVKVETATPTQMSNIPFAIHKGNVIFQSTEGDFPRGANVYVGSLGTDIKRAKQLLEYDTYYATKGGVYSTDPVEVWDMWADDDYFYYVGVTKKEEGNFKQVVYRYDPKSEENKIIWETPEPNEVGEWENSGVQTNGWYITDGVLYFFLSGNGIWRSDLATGINEQVVEVNDDRQRGTAAFDEEYIYINNGNEESVVPYEDRTINVYDYSGNYVGSIACGDMYKYSGAYIQSAIPFINEWTGVVGADSENVFIAYYAYGQNVFNYKLFFIRKGNLQDSVYEQIIETFYEWDSVTDETYEYKS